MELNKFIDHTILKPDSTKRDVEIICEQANEFKFAAVCVAPCWISVCKTVIEAPIQVATVIGFPHGNSSILSKCLQIHHEPNVDEFDIVLNIGRVKGNEWNTVEEEIMAVRRDTAKTIKYIVEVGYLTDDELFRIADLLIKHKIDFIKTCTGYGPRNVTIEDIVKIKKHVGNAIKIKASGGIKTAEFATQLIEAGADRIGTSAGVSIMNETR